ncbi:hypothetical protein CONPUDRAFT_158023 [Coniophora puteana RWD-64-598 SS2]|uniref:C2H2-type domain-containing protein n=1 Tax=Coniophora puteana (strain RWD-64-598) TaxID=741705 RepID=A0A5M3ME66_CONPW|nr:uncharacterized protein CONPUDRAFT_158023 [Coniophora puteana RWD-64-598 SS2]EIW76871.1 hypothetical protein CONPUDRAFT_158023 [Coniophora puteana RWD-64-598 SS2]
MSHTQCPSCSQSSSTPEEDLLSQRPLHSLLRYPCRAEGCSRLFKSKGGLTKHISSYHDGLVDSSPAPSSPPPVDHDLQDEPPMDSFQPEDHELPEHLEPQSEHPRGRVEELDGGKRIREYHPVLTGDRCNPDGSFISEDNGPFPLPARAPDDWHPFRSRVEFETADFLYRRSQAPAGHIDILMDLWGATLRKHGDTPPFADHKDLYKTIDAIKAGDVPWESFSMSYKGAKPAGAVPPWMTQSYDVWFRDPQKVVRNILGNADFRDGIDYSPYREFDDSGHRQFEHMFSGDWAWQQADEIAANPGTDGCTFVPIILGSDKTTVSVATGQTEYYPLYLSIGNVHNNIRRAHSNAVDLIGFLSIPKTNQSFTGDPVFRHFCRQLYHSSLSRILQSLRPGMTTYEVVRFGDGYFRRVMYGLGPYIADYPEQALLGCIVQGWCPKCLAFRDDLDGEPALPRTREHDDIVIEELDLGTLWDYYGVIGNVVPFTNDFPRADIHELITPDILHQLIKGSFKDHLVEWVVSYFHKKYNKAKALSILDDIDRRIAAVAPFAGLRRFPNGRGFKQWTGDDSKALMKVYLAAIEGYVPRRVVRAFRAFLEFCYLVRRDVQTEETLREIDDALERFHKYRKVFTKLKVTTSISLPRQHSLIHYAFMIRQFGAPNGLCSSITESMHIKAVKEPWRRSSRFEALKQMLLTNQRLAKLAAYRVELTARGMLQGKASSESDVLNVIQRYDSIFYFAAADPDPTTLIRIRGMTGGSVDVAEDERDCVINKQVEAKVKLAKTKARKRARSIPALAEELTLEEFDLLYQVRCFLYNSDLPTSQRGSVDVSAVPVAQLPPFDPKARIYVYNSAAATFRAPSDISGIHGMRRERIRSTLNWRNEAPRHDCAFVSTDEDVPGMLGMEVARVMAFFSFDYSGTHVRSFIGFLVQAMCEIPTPVFIPVGSLVRAAHLIPYYGSDPVPETLKHYDSYNDFHVFYVNRDNMNVSTIPPSCCCNSLGPARSSLANAILGCRQPTASDNDKPVAPLAQCTPPRWPTIILHRPPNTTSQEAQPAAVPADMRSLPVKPRASHGPN